MSEIKTKSIDALAAYFNDRAEEGCCYAKDHTGIGCGFTLDGDFALGPIVGSTMNTLREPDPAMIRAGMCVLEEIRGANHVRRADMELVEAIWRAMVEEALR